MDERTGYFVLVKGQDPMSFPDERQAIEHAAQIAQTAGELIQVVELQIDPGDIGSRRTRLVYETWASKSFPSPERRSGTTN